MAGDEDYFGVKRTLGRIENFMVAGVFAVCAVLVFGIISACILKDIRDRLPPPATTLSR